VFKTASLKHRSVIWTKYYLSPLREDRALLKMYVTISFTFWVKNASTLVVYGVEPVGLPGGIFLLLYNAIIVAAFESSNAVAE
jgi:hypothetical protein